MNNKKRWTGLHRTVRKSAPAFFGRRQILVGATSFVPSRDAIMKKDIISCLEIHLGFAANQETTLSSIEELETFDFNNDELMKKYQPEFTVSRQPKIKVMSQKHRKFLDDVLEKANSKFPDSSYIVIQDCAEFDDSMGIIIPEKGDPVEARQMVLPRMLDNGQLNGCQLKGSKETGQFGLVAKQNLGKWTPIAVDCGFLWSDDLHDEWLNEIGNPMPALSSTEIPMRIFESFFSKRTWISKGGKVLKRQSFIMDCFSHGNEVKHLDDAGWINIIEGGHKCNANVDAFAVLSLKNDYLSVVYCVNRDVQEGEELTMDWGCWREISSKMLPSQAFLSHSTQLKLDKVKSDLEKRRIPVPAPELYKDIIQKTLQEAHYTFRPANIDKKIARQLTEKYSTQKTALHYLYTVVFEGGLSQESADQDANTTLQVIDLDSIGINSSLDRTVRPAELGKLSQFARNMLDKLKKKMDPKVKKMLRENILDRVEVREILDYRNPAKLFALPNQKVHGVFAKKTFKIDDPVLCYSGYLMDTEAEFDPFNAYLFDMDSAAYFDGDTGGEVPDLFIDGKDSIAGKINDSISIGGSLKRAPNLTSFCLFDSETNNPIIVLYATREIKEGDELLYNYGAAYWRSIWKGLMIEHSDFVAKTDVYIKQLCALLPKQKLKPSVGHHKVARKNEV